MADSFFCSFLDFRSLTTNNCNFHLFLPPKQYYPCGLVHSHNSRIKRRKRRQFHLTLLSKPSSLAPSSSHIDLISTHEHSDGSILFRFGDPSEAAKNVKIEESNLVNEEEKEKEDETGYVKVLDSDHEKEVSVEKAVTEVSVSSLTEVDDDTDSIVISGESVTISEEQNDSCNKLLEGSSDVELPVLISSKETEVISTGDVDTERTENVESNITTLELSEKASDDTYIPDVEIEQSVNTEEGTNEEQRDLSQSDASVLENSSEMENIITTVELLENEVAEVTTLDSSIPENKFIEASADSVPSDTPSILENNSKIENNVTTEELSETESADVTTLDSSIADPVSTMPGNGFLEDNADSSPSDTPSILENNSEMENYVTTKELWETTVPESDVFQDSVEDTIVITDVPEVSKQQNDVESEMQIETIKADGIEGSESDLAQSEPAVVSLSEEIEEQKLTTGEGIETDTGVQNEIVGNENGSNLNDTNEVNSLPIESTTVSAQLEAESMFDEKASIGSVEESGEDDVAESLTVSNDSEEASADDEVTEPTAATSQEIVSTDFVLSSGAALLPHPSKVLTGGEDAYFIAGQTWLGVADGVGQWSFQGTKPGVYALELVKICEMLVSNSDGDSVNNPLELLKLGVSETDSAGSSTVLIARFDGQALHVANIGDSGFIVLRHGDVYKRSSPMHHAFYFPHRIESGDDPSSLAELYRVDLEDKDVIITATDGLLDNLYDQEISSIVEKSLADDKKPEEIAELLAREAQERGCSASGRSPFGDDAELAGFAGYTGGKLDDVAVIISVVGRKSDVRTL